LTRPLLRDPAFRAYLAANALERLAPSALTVLLGFQVYELTRNPLDLGWLGLAEAVPAVGLVLLGGHAADRLPRRRLVLLGTAALALLAACLAAAAGGGHALPVLFGAAVLTGAVSAFADPALLGLEAHVVPVARLVPGLALLAATGRTASMLGPAAGGLAWAALGPAGTYAALAALFAGSAAVMAAGVSEAPVPAAADGGGAWRSIREGVAFVFRSEVLLGSMALDLFAVFFGGAAALLPVFATDVLGAGPAGFGLLRSAGAAGSLAAAVLAARLLPRRRAGGAVAAWGGGGVRGVHGGVRAIAVAGAVGGGVVRGGLVRRDERGNPPGDPAAGLAGGDAGRIAAVRSVFLSSSNELGAFESGVAASLVGAQAAVWGGGLVTLGVVAVVAWRAPGLRGLDLGVLGPGAEIGPS